MTGWLMIRKLSEPRAGARFSIMVFLDLRGGGGPGGRKRLAKERYLR